MGPEAFDRSDLFTARLEAKNSSSSPANFFLLLEYRQKNDVSLSLLPRIDDKN